MTGICYFSDDTVDYLAERQVTAVAEYDTSIAFKENGAFSPEKADHAINEAIENNCDKLVFLTEDENVELLSRLIPQEYGRCFNEIQVIPENFYRIYENDQAAQPTQTQTQPAGPNANNGTKETAAVVKNKVVFMCDAAAPSAQALQGFIQFVDGIRKSGLPQQGLDLNTLNESEVECWFMNVDNAGLCASGVSTLYGKHPSSGVQNTVKNCNFLDSGWDGKCADIIMQAATSKTVQNGGKYFFIVPTSAAQIQSNNENVVVINSGKTFENPNNKVILPLIQELSKGLADAKGDGGLKYREVKDEDLAKGLQKDENKIKFIAIYQQLFTWWSKHKEDKRAVKDSKNLLEEYLKAGMKDILNGFGLSDIENGVYGNGIGGLVKGIEKVGKDIKDKFKQNDKDDTEKKLGDQKANQTKKIYTWDKYETLCKALGLEN